MDAQDFNQLLEAQSAFNELFSQYQSTMHFAAVDLKKRHQEAFYELYPEEKDKTYSKKYEHAYRWMFASDWAEIATEEDEVGFYAQFWERGRCGDRDEMLHQIKFTPQMLTEEGRQAIADDWKKSESTKAQAAKQKAEAARLAKIRDLETQLTQLKGE